MVKCPNPDCGYENVDGTQFCEGCGEELPAAGGAASAPAAAAIGGDLIKCPACENLNPADNVVCEVCGTELHPGAAAAPAPSAPAPAVPATAALEPDADAGIDAIAGAAVTSAVSAVQGSLNADPALTTDPAADAPAISIPGLSDTTPADDTTPVVDTVDTQLDPAAVAPAAGAGLEPGQVKLVVEQGMTVGKQFVLGDNEILVGREDEDEQIYPDIDLSDQDEGYVHRKHAALKFAGGTLTVEHLGGANKTRLNNRPLPDNEPNPVKIGDKIAFGKVVMRVQAV